MAIPSYKQGSSGFVFLLTLEDFDLTDTTEIRVLFLRPNGTSYERKLSEDTVQTIDEPTGQISVESAPTDLTVVGLYEFAVRLIGADFDLESETAQFQVEESLFAKAGVT